MVRSTVRRKDVRVARQRREEVGTRASWPHIDECREGMERLMMQDLTGADRAVRAKTLHEEALARHIRTYQRDRDKQSDGEAQLQRTRGDQPYSSVSIHDQQCCCHQRRTSATPHQPSRHTPFFFRGSKVFGALPVVFGRMAV